MDRNSCLNYFQAFPFWEHMTEEDRNFLLDNIRELHYPAGAAIQSEERQCLGTLFLLKGVLRVYLLSAQGKEATLYRLKDSDICTLSVSCMLSAITGASRARANGNDVEAALAAVVHMGAAGQAAQARMKEGDGTGSFHTYLMDALSLLEGDDLAKAALVEEVR